MQLYPFTHSPTHSPTSTSWPYFLFIKPLRMNSAASCRVVSCVYRVTWPMTNLYSRAEPYRVESRDKIRGLKRHIGGSCVTCRFSSDIYLQAQKQPSLNGQPDQRTHEISCDLSTLAIHFELLLLLLLMLFTSPQFLSFYNSITRR